MTSASEVNKRSKRAATHEERGRMPSRGWQAKRARLSASNYDEFSGLETQSCHSGLRIESGDQFQQSQTTL